MLAATILADLVGIDSRSSLSNEAMIAWIERFLAPLGFATRRLAYRDAAGVEKTNLVALSGGPGEPELALVGHTDTVPFDPAWADALTLTSRDGNLYGRGACDTKGFVAAALAAVARLEGRRLERPLALLFTADEEVGCVGAKELVRTLELRPRRAIVGEPTSLTPIRAHKGYVLARLDLVGAEAHSAHPEAGASAILAAGEMLTRLEDLSRIVEREVAPAFDPPFATLNVGIIQGGTAENIVPGHCQLTLEWRPLPGQPSARLLEALGAAARDVGATRGVQISVQAVRDDAGFEMDANGSLVKFLEERVGKSASTASYFTEAPFLAALGAESVVFGPGDIRHAHKTGEFVPEDELERCSEVLGEAIERWCGG